MQAKRPLEGYEQLPFPIAYPIHRCRSRNAWQGPDSRARHVNAALDALIRFLTLVAVSDYLLRGAFEPCVNDRLLRCLRAKPTFGEWVGLLREVVLAFVTQGRPTRPTGMADLLFVCRRGKPKPSSFLRALDKLVNHRNIDAHKSWRDNAFTIEERCDLLAGLLPDLAFLANHWLIVPLTVDPAEPRTITELVVCMGHSDFVREALRIEIPEDLGPAPPKFAPLLLDEAGRRVLLPLFPLHLFEVGLRSDREDCLYSYVEADWKESRPQQLHFAPNQPNQEELKIEPHGERDFVFEAFLQRFAAVLPGNPDARPTRLRSFRIASLDAEIEQLHRDFVGRTAQREQLRHHLEQRQSGYVCYLAPSGAGKSAYAAYLIKEHGWPGHLIKRDSQRDQPLRFLQCLLACLMERHGFLEDIPAAQGPLEEKLYDVLQRVGDKLRRQGGTACEVLVLDGLHLLAADIPAGFLFEMLPPRIFIILLSQKCPLIDELCLRVRGQTDWTYLALDGLTEKESHAYLDQAEARLSPGDREAVVRRAAGLPFYLERVARAVRAGLPWTEVEIDLEQHYRRAIDQAFTVDQSIAERLLGVLCVAREPLSAIQLADDILGLGVRRVRPVLEKIEPHLQVVRQKVTLAHESFREVLARELGADILQTCHKEMVRWSQRRLTPPMP